MKLLVAALVVIVVLVLFNLPQLRGLQPRGTAAPSSSGTAPSAPRRMGGGVGAGDMLQP